MKQDPCICILDDDADVTTAARLLLRRHFAQLVVLHRPAQLQDAILQHQPAVLLLDMNFAPGLSSGEEGLQLLRQLVCLKDAPTVIMMTAYAEVSLAVEALKIGAFDFITKPWDNAKLVATVHAALAQRAPAQSAAQWDLLGDSAPMRHLRTLIASVGPTDANVLVLGENGGGKELVAHAIHRASRRAAHTLLSVDMGALPETMFESEMFGHLKGSFTDARSERQGRFQAAKGGTLFLDEIGNMPLHHQAKLLTALERRQVTKLGSDRPEVIDVRIVCATNLDEAQLFDPQRFRADLLYRINTIVLRVPPLRERREDIVPIAQHYLAHYTRQYNKPERSLGESAKRALTACHWPGNVRALRHACERAVILAQCGEAFEAHDFSLDGRPVGAPPVTESNPPPEADLPMGLREREREATQSAMHDAAGNISQAAKALGISRAALYRKLEKHGL